LPINLFASAYLLVLMLLGCSWPISRVRCKCCWW